MIVKCIRCPNKFDRGNSKRRTCSNKCSRAGNKKQTTAVIVSVGNNKKELTGECKVEFELENYL